MCNSFFFLLSLQKAEHLCRCTIGLYSGSELLMICLGHEQSGDHLACADVVVVVDEILCRYGVLSVACAYALVVAGLNSSLGCLAMRLVQSPAFDLGMDPIVL